MFENLEKRQLLASAALAGGVLTVLGDSNRTNTLQVEFSGSTQIVAKFNGAQKFFAKSAVKEVVIRGGDKADYLATTNSATIKSTIRAGSGNDTIWSGGGNDVIYGDGGNDSISGRNGNDTIYGGAGNDTIDGGGGHDKYDGGGGSDVYRNVESRLTTTPSTGGSTGSPSTGGSSTGSGTGTDPTPFPGTGTTGTPNAVIAVQTSNIPAGNAIHVHALSSSLNGGSQTTARYEWDFGDPGSKYNTLVGWNAAHQYTRPGTYTIKLRVTNEGGKSDSVTRQINVSSANRRQIYVSSSGSDSSSGSSSSPVKTLSRARAIAGSGNNTEILLRRGDTFSVGDSISFTGDNVAISAYGSGALPTVRWDGARKYSPIFFFSGSNVLVENLSITSKFTDREKTNMPDGLSLGGHNITVRGVEFLNIGNAVNSNAQPTGVLVQESTAPSDVGLRSYFVWVEGNDHVLLGNRVANSTREATFRVSRNAQRLLVHDNVFTNRSRVSAGDSLDTAKNTVSVQWGAHAYLSDNTFNNGPVRIGPLGEADGHRFPTSRFNNTVMEGNTFNAPVFTLHGASDTVYRNNVGTANGYPAYTIEGYNSAYGRGVNNVTLVNNTVRNDSFKGKFLDVGGSVNGITLVNNLYSAPDLQPGAFEAAPVFVTSSDLSSFRAITNNVWSVGKPLPYAEGGMNYVWSNWSNAQGYHTAAEWNARPQVGTDVFSNVSVGSNFAPSSSSAAANAGRLFGGVFTDINGKIRPSSGGWSAGAVQV